MRTVCLLLATRKINKNEDYLRQIWLHYVKDRSDLAEICNCKTLFLGLSRAPKIVCQNSAPVNEGGVKRVKIFFGYFLGLN